MYPETVDPVLQEYSEYIADFGFVSGYLTELYIRDPSDSDPLYYSTYMSKVQSPSDRYYVHYYGISPSKLLDSGISLHNWNKTTALGPSEQLYTAAGSQSLGCFHNMYGIEQGPDQLYLMQVKNSFEEDNDIYKYAAYKLRQIFTYNSNNFLF